MVIGPFIGIVGAVARRPRRGARRGPRRWRGPGRTTSRARAGRGLAGARRDDAGLAVSRSAAGAALAILRIRTFLEHQAHERAAARSVDHRGSRAAGDPVSQQQLPCGAPRQPAAALVPAAGRVRAAAGRVAAAATAATATAPTARSSGAPPLPPQGPGRPSDLDPAEWRPPRPHPVARAAAARVTVGAVAALPMYDWPEVTDATDALWAAIRDAAARARASPRPRRSPATRAVAGWTDPGLVLGQTCGLPFVRTLAGRVAVVGALDYGLPGCPPGLVPERGGRAGGRSARRPRRLPRRDGWRSTARIPSRAGARSSTTPRRSRRTGASSARSGRRAPTARRCGRSPPGRPTSPRSTW